MTVNLKDKLMAMIKAENKKNPLTDEQLAEKLNVLRETVTGIIQVQGKKRLLKLLSAQ